MVHRRCQKALTASQEGLRTLLSQAFSIGPFPDDLTRMGISFKRCIEQWVGRFKKRVAPRKPERAWPQGDAATNFHRSRTGERDR